MAETPKVDSLAPGYERMSKTHWNLITALEGGTPAMREASLDGSFFLPGYEGSMNEFLPRLEKEDISDWHRRLKMTYLHPGFTKGVTRISAKPFGKKLVVQGEELLSPRMRLLIDNTDGQGKSLHQLAREITQDGWSRGLFHVGVDLPRLKVKAKTRQDEMRLVPRIFRIKPVDLIDWPYEIDENGNIDLQQIRFRETGTTVNGFAMEETERIRVWNSDGTWELWEKGRTDNDTSEKWRPIVEPTQWGFQGIPLVTGYFAQTGFMEAESPLADVAWLNLAHWQSSSRQRWYLDFARFSFLFGRGFGKDENKGKTVLSPQTMVTAQNPQAELMVVEHQGHAIGSGQADLDDLERRMDEASLKPMQTKGGTPTAAARWLDEASVQCDAQACVMEVESKLTEAIHIAAAWIGEKVSDEVKVKLPGDVLLRRNSEDVATLMEAFDRRLLDRESLLEEMLDRGMLRDNRPVDEILERLEKDRPDDDAALAGAGSSRKMLAALKKTGALPADFDEEAALGQMDEVAA